MQNRHSFISENRKRNQGLLFLIVPLLALVIFNGFGNNMLYLFSGVTLMLISAMLTMFIRVTRDIKTLFLCIVFWTSYHVIGAVFEWSFSTLYGCFQHIGILFFFWLMLNIERFYIEKERIMWFFPCLNVVVFSLLVVIILFFPEYKARFESNVYIGLVTLPFLLNLLKKRRLLTTVFLCVFWVFICIAMGARAQIVSFALFLPIYVLLLQIRKKEKLNSILFTVYYSVLSIFPIFYVYLGRSQYRRPLDNLTLRITGSRFFSGRDMLWNSVFERIENWGDFLFGLGFYETTELISSNAMSLHNLYITLLSQGGVFLVVLMGIILFHIWKMLCKSDTQISRLVMTLMLVILYKQSFDISLIENNLWLAFVAWTAFAMGISEPSRQLGKEDMV